MEFLITIEDCPLRIFYWELVNFFMKSSVLVRENVLFEEMDVKSHWSIHLIKDLLQSSILRNTQKMNSKV